jgi:hypothetical protein
MMSAGQQIRERCWPETDKGDCIMKLKQMVFVLFCTLVFFVQAPAYGQSTGSYSGKGEPKTARGYVDRGRIFAERKEYDIAIEDFTNEFRALNKNGPLLKLGSFPKHDRKCR